MYAETLTPQGLPLQAEHLLVAFLRDTQHLQIEARTARITPCAYGALGLVALPILHHEIAAAQISVNYVA